jgi:maltose alpha-D-glucosyltransferase/alpha-amylase
MLVDLLATNDSRANRHGTHQVQLEPYAYRWFRAEGLDRNVPRV